MRMTRRRSCALLAAGLALLAAACGDGRPPGAPPEASTSEKAAPAQKQPATVAVLNDLPRFSELDPARNTRTGFDVSLASWLADNQVPGFIANFTGVTVEQRVGAITDRGVDYVVAALSITSEKEGRIGLAGPYLITRQGFMTRSGKSPITSLDQLSNGVSVCTIDGSTSAQQLQPLADAQRIYLTREKSNTSCTDRLLRREADVFSTDQIILAAFAARSNGELTVSPFTFGSSEEYGIGYRRGDRERCLAIRNGIIKYIKDGIWDTNFKVYFPGLDPTGYRPDPDALNQCP